MTTRRDALALIGGVILAGAAPTPAYGPAYNVMLFDHVWDLVDRRYWDRGRLDWTGARDRFRPQAIAAADGRALYHILSAMLATVGDSHVYVRSPDAVARDAAAGPRAEFGLSAWPVAGIWRVLSVRYDGPAAAAGVRPGWLLSTVDGRPVDDDRQPLPGERARFGFCDLADRPRDIVLTSAMLPPLAARRVQQVADDILLLGFDVFAGGEARWIADSLADAPPSVRLILDLRENEGGEAIAVARVAGMVFDRKRVLLRRVARDRMLDVPIFGARPRSFAGPLALLVGPRSASGAEILAALVQDSGRGIVVGERTAGAVTGAARLDLPDGGELWVAVFDIRTATGARLEGHGLVPAYPAVQTLADLRAGRDVALDRAVAMLRAG